MNPTITNKIIQNAREESEFSELLKNNLLDWKKTLPFSTRYFFQLLPTLGMHENP